MADYWKSQGRKFCDFCKCWIADNKPSIEFHEGGRKHKENVSKRLKEIHKNSAKQAKQNKKFEDDLKKMESAAMAAYLKDVENNTKDITAERIIKDKLQRSETKDFPYDVDPCEPVLSMRGPPRPRLPPALAGAGAAAAPQRKGPQTFPDNKSQGKGKSAKGRGKPKKSQEEDRQGRKPLQKLWYEALSPEGYTYYWHTETNESVWDPPEEGYMSLSEQEQEVKEQTLQQELLEQLEKEEAITRADILEEKRANAERERMKKLRKRARKANGGPDREKLITETGQALDDQEGQEEEEEVEEEKEEEAPGREKTGKEGEEDRPYRRDYSIPEKVDPYGPWKTVQKVERKPVDLQLPQQKQVQVPLFEKAEPAAPLQKVFKEKTVMEIRTGDSDDENGKPTTFKKRKIAKKSVRQRLADD